MNHTESSGRYPEILRKLFRGLIAGKPVIAEGVSLYVVRGRQRSRKMEAAVGECHHPVSNGGGKEKGKQRKKPRTLNVSAETEWEIEIRKSESSQSLSPLLAS